MSTNIERELGEITEGIRGLHRYMTAHVEQGNERQLQVTRLLEKYDSRLDSLQVSISLIKGVGVAIAAVFTGLSGYWHYLK